MHCYPISEVILRFQGFAHESDKWREIKIQVINTRTENNKTFHSYNGNGNSIE